MSLQLFLVPPKQLDEWDDEFEKEFSKWKCRESNINSNKSDYRQYIINLNLEYNLDKIYDNLEIGLEAFKKLRELITRFPQYKLNDNLEKLYSDSENVRDFITWGAEFVGSLDSDTVDLAIDCPNEPVGQPTNIDNEVAGSEPDGQLGYSDKKAPDVEARIVESSSEPEEQSAEDVSKNNDEVVDTPVTKKGKSSNSSRKAKRRKRLLKYQQKLVDTRGLPPSRLMQQTPETPELSSGLETPNLRRRNLLDNFAEYACTVPVVPLPVGTPQAAVHPSEMIGQVKQPLVGVYGTSSTQSKLPMLCSISPPWASGLGTGPVGGWSTGWPEARPMMGSNFDMPQSSYVYCGGNSTSMNQTSLSPSSQYMPGCQEDEMTVSGADREEQNDELLALSGILDTTAFSHSESKCGGHKGVLEVVVRVPGEGLIEIVRGNGKPNFTVKYLPPVKLEFSLPADYPSQACPLYCITCPWLLEVQRKKLEEQLRNLWDEQGGGVILFTWLNFLQEDLLEFLGVVSQIDLSAFAERTISVNEEPKLACDKNDNLNLIDDDELRTSPESDDSKHAEEDPTIANAPINGVIPSVVEAGDKAPTTCSVLQWDVSKQCGVLDTGRGEALVKHSSIVGHNVNKLEASLEVGEKVECRLEEMKSKWEGVNRTLEAFDVSGVGGRMVRGSKKVENVKVLEEDVMGSVVRWSKRARDGMLKGPKGDVYVYYTCVQGEDSLFKGDKVVFHVVESQKWGVLASFVRKWKEDGIEREEELELNRMRNERDKRGQNVGASEPANLTGWVKKWNDDTGKGIIRSEGGKEWSFNSKDCLVKGEVGFKLFSKGDRVTFEHSGDNHGATPRATSVMLAGELDSGVGSNNSSVDLPIVHHVDMDMVEVKEFKGEKEKLSLEPALPGTSGKQEKPVENPLIPKRMRRHSSRQQQLATLLREFNNMKEEEEFAVSLNSCLICFTDKIGSQCLRFVVCNHVYCKDCMANYFKEKISTGAVSSLMCPTFKCDTQALPNQVAELVPHDLFQKYESLLLETQLESMTDVVNCPRVVCQCPTMIDRETNMGQCPACQLAFCIYCKATYHGVSPCKFKSTEQRAILERYNNSTGDEKTFLEKRYGKKQLATMSANLASEDYMASHARQCPHCNAPIEKNEGCNKITCWRCNTHFCWLCGLKLPQVNPYTHFNVQGGKCFGALFQGIDPLAGDDEFDDFFDEDDDWQAVQAALLGV